MADTKISALSAVVTLANADEFAVNQSATSKKLTGTVFRDYLGNSFYKVSVAAQSPAAGSTVYLTDSSISIPALKLRAGSSFRWDLDLSKTAAGVAARSMLIKVGTAGTTADATIATLTNGTPTGVADEGYYRILFTIRTIGAAATSRASSLGTHNLSTTGLLPNETEYKRVAGTTFDSTVANLIVGLAVTTGASEALTFDQIICQALNV
jgi:hypothetical protein